VKKAKQEKRKNNSSDHRFRHHTDIKINNYISYDAALATIP